jgi:uncharacterized integral membrane protein
VDADEPRAEETSAAGRPATPDQERTAAEANPRTVRTGTGIMPAVVLGVLLAVATIIFIAQNSDRIALEFLWFDFRTSPGALVLMALLLGIVADEIIGVLVRRHRRRRLNEREELQRLRSRATTTE